MNPPANRPNFRTSCWTLIAVVILTLSLTVAGYSAWHIRHSQHQPLAGRLSADKGYGVTTDLTQYDSPELRQNLQLMADNGLTWVRQPFPWAEIEPQRGQFNWQPFDRMLQELETFNQQVATAHTARPNDHFNIKLIATLHTAPAWAILESGAEDARPLKEWSDFGHFARQVATRYGGQIDHYQIWHEPNLSANWGQRHISPEGYADLLREAAINIRAVDPTAVIILAGLAPTLEHGPLNLNELAYLDRLYQAQADRWFDVVSTQIYGFATETTTPANPDELGFNRTELTRQLMLNHGDAATPIWATAFGWTVIDDDWTGRKSLWKQAIPAVQSQRTANGVRDVRYNWPWLGPMLAVRWDTADLAEGDPAAGFSIIDHPEILGAFQTMRDSVHVATVGQYPATHLSGRYEGDWRFAEQTGLVDMPRVGPRVLKVAFKGTRFDLTVNRGPYQAYLWVTVDKDEAAMQREGERYPANRLPTNAEGQSYLLLYDPLHNQETVTLARNLEPGFHEIELVAEGGWGQWAIAGWTVYDEMDTRNHQLSLTISLLVGALSSLPVFWLLFQTFLGLSRSLWAWSEQVIAGYGRLGEGVQVGLTFGLGLALYLSPEWLALAILPLLAITVLLRPDLGLALIVVSLSFFQRPVDLPFKDFSPVEFTLALTLFGLLGRGLIYAGRVRYRSESWAVGLPLSEPLAALRWPTLKSIDYAVLALVGLGFLATLNAENFGVSMFEWRRVILESAIFYGLVRLGLNYQRSDTGNIVKLSLFRMTFLENRSLSLSKAIGFRQAQPACSTNLTPLSDTTQPQPDAWAWRLVHALILGAVIHSLLGLYLYGFTDQVITAEGVRRVVGPAYGSPNNLALFLERVWPILVAVIAVGVVQLFSPSRIQLAESHPSKDGELLKGGTDFRSATALAVARMWQRRQINLSHAKIDGVNRPPVEGEGNTGRFWLYLLSLMIISLTIFLTFSRGSLLIGLPLAFISMAVFYVAQHQAARRRVFMVVAVGLLILVVALAPLSQTERFQTVFDASPGSTTFVRLKLWQSSLMMLQDYWPLGMGLDNFLYEYRTRYMLPEAFDEPNLNHPHNIVLDFGLRLGIGGILILGWLQVAFWREAWPLYRQRRDGLTLGLMGSMVIVMGHGLVDNSYFLVDLAFIFSLTLGVVVGLREGETQGEE